VLDRGDPAIVYLADAHFFGEGFDLGFGSLRAGSIHVRDVHRAVVVDVDLGARRFLNTLDGFAARTDQQAHLFRVDLDRQESRRPRADLGARIAERRDDMPQDFASRVARLVQSGPDDLLVDAVGL